jgi:hypothetical protein
LKVETREQDDQLNNQPGVNLKTVYRSLLKIVAQIGETAYTDSMLRQTDEVELDDLADPASGDDTRRAETHCT